MDSINLNFLTHTKLISQIWKAYKNPYKISFLYIYIVGICRSHLRRVISIWMRKHFSCFKSMNRLLFLVLYLLWFSTHKKLLYTKLMEIIWAFHRTLPFFYSCLRTRVISSEASPLFFGSPLIQTQIQMELFVTFGTIKWITTIFRVLLWIFKLSNNRKF